MKLILLLSAAGFAAAATPALARDKDLRTMTSADGETEVGFCSVPAPTHSDFPGTPSSRSARRSPAAPGLSRRRPYGCRRNERLVGRHQLFRRIERRGKAGGGALYVDEAGVPRPEGRSFRLCECAGGGAADSDRGWIPADVAASAERYTLGSDDCITFARKVASVLAAAGLVVPARSSTDTPGSWIEKLSAANP